MDIISKGKLSTWREVADAARTTIWKEEGEGEPSFDWKKNILLAEHSPIRKLRFCGKWVDLPYYSSVHLTRHKIGVIQEVSSQRPERKGEPRAKKPVKTSNTIEEFVHVKSFDHTKYNEKIKTGT